MYLIDYRNICAVCPSIGNAKELKECLRLTWSEGSCHFHLITACKELCEGYVFTHVCHSVHGGVYPSMPCRSLGGMYPSMLCRFPGPHPGGSLRGLARGGLQAHTQWGSWGVWPRGSPGPHLGGCIPACTEADPPPADGYCCGRYASYWNAFLLHSIFCFN